MTTTTYTPAQQQRGLGRLRLMVGLLIGTLTGPVLYSVLDMGALPTCY